MYIMVPGVPGLRKSLGGGNSNIFYFHPEIWGRCSPILTNIFQRAWFNHKLDQVSLNYPILCDQA